MTERRLSAYRALASESRVEILALLQQRGEPVPVDEVASSVGLHVNTVREHLDRLVASGFVERQPEVRTTRGRPRMLYRSVDRAAAATIDARAREHLTRMLLEGYGRPLTSAGCAAEQAGEQWAEDFPRLCQAPVPDQALAPRDGTEPEALWVQLAALEQHFEDLGFAPEADAEQLEIHLRRCPFYDLARERTEVVCGVHLGLARGVLAHEGGPLRAESLEPFVGPRHCVLHLRRA
ncbi:helix-turn-helix transcriptional regulator [Actinotalea subterranea]|uniref:helix-turn-helix transcriptional regulator n=1 Tax=Actinotalea subterranea TaxID=2607497 RepID=UPI0011EC3212|nr:helix-turn-helix domain-containing protein [Actinotalea subterranea]